MRKTAMVEVELDFVEKVSDPELLTSVFFPSNWRKASLA